MTSILSSSSFSISGIVSGLETSDIISQYMDIERKPIARLETKKESVNEKLTAWRDLNTRVLALQTNTNRIKNENYFQVRSATSSNEDILTATAASGVSTSSHSIKVMAMAQDHQIASQSYSATDAKLGAGSINVTVDGISNNIEVDAEMTLQQLKEEINKGDYGVTAGIVNAGNDNYRLVLSSKTSGTDGAIEISSSLVGGEAPVFTTIQEAQDAHIKLGSGDAAIDIYKSTNVINDVIDGVTLNLKTADPDNTVTVKLSSNTTQARSTIEGFITQYNNMVDYFDQQFDYDADSGSSGVLFSDSSLFRIKEDLYKAVTDRVGGDGQYQSLESLGIGIGTDGKLLIQSESTLNEALEGDLDGVIKFFTDDDTGMGDRVAGYLDTILNSQTGILRTTEQSYLSQIEDLDETIAQKEEYLTSVELRYKTKFTEMETALAKIKSQSDYLNAQIEAMANNSYSSST